MVISACCGATVFRSLTRGYNIKFVRGCGTESAKEESGTECVSKRPWTKRLHIYGYSNRFGSQSEFARVMERNVIYNEGGLVAVNKPSGVGKERPPKNKNIKGKFKTSPVNDDFYLQDILPHLAKTLGYEALGIIRAPERHTSGVALLSPSVEVAANVKKCIRRSKALNLFSDTYWVVSLGQPEPSSSMAIYGLTVQEDKIHGDKVPILITEWAKREVERNDVIPVKVAHETLSSSTLASLVKVQPSKVKAHFMRVYMAYMLSPILGDNLYGSRVQKIQNVPLMISPFSERARMPQRLDDAVLKALVLNRKEELFVPAHIHLQNVTLLGFKDKNQSLVIEAPPSESFQWTCKQLSLKFPEENQEVAVQCL